MTADLHRIGPTRLSDRDEPSMWIGELRLKQDLHLALREAREVVANVAITQDTRQLLSAIDDVLERADRVWRTDKGLRLHVERTAAE